MKVTLRTFTELKNNSVITKLDTDELNELGYSEGEEVYVTDELRYPKNTVSRKREVTLVSLASLDEGVYLARLSDGKDIYMHTSWFGGEIINTNILKIDDKYYDANSLVAKDIKMCKCCNKVVPLYKDTKYCKSCFDSEFLNINSYSYKPTPKFYGEQLTGDKDNPVWYGIELEYSVKNKDDFVWFNYLHNNDKQKFYLKSDRSIHAPSGCELTAELVTHPHSFKELMSCDWVNKLDSIKVFDNSDTRKANGCHIHISRTAFKSKEHYSKWYFFMYSLVDNVLNKIGKRDCTSYCQNVKYGNILLKDNSPKRYERAVVINENNEKTVEVRVFSSTNKSKELKQYIQLLESTIKYSKYSEKVMNYDGWFSYVNKYSEKYSELLEALTEIPDELKKKAKDVVYPDTFVTVDDVMEIPSKYIQFITKLYINNKEVLIESLQFDFVNNTVKVNGRDPISIDNISRITYAM